MADKHETTSTDLVEQVKEFFVKNLSGGRWRPAKELEALIPDALAQARCGTVSALAIADLKDPKEYARLLLTKDALQALEASDTCEVRGAEGKQEVRLVRPDGVAEVAAPPAATAASWDKSDVSVVQTTTQADAQTGGKDVSGPTTNSDNATPAGTTDVNKPVAVQSDTSARDTDARAADEMASDSVPEMPFHPVAELFPLMTQAEYEELKNDIKVNGLLVAIWIYEGKIIDGRNRDRACRELGIQPRFQEWDGRGSLVAFIISLNQHRRHLSASQRAVVAARAKKMFEEEARQRMLTGKADPTLKSEEGHTGEAAAQAATLFEVGRDSVYKAQAALRDGSPELQQAVTEGQVSVSTAADLTGLGHEEQDAALAQGPAAVRARAKEGAQRKKATDMAANDGAVRRSRTKGDGTQGTAVTEEAKKKADEAERFQHFLHALTELEAVWTLDKGGFVTRARKLAQKERGRLKARLDNLGARAKKLGRKLTPGNRHRRGPVGNRLLTRRPGRPKSEKKAGRRSLHDRRPAGCSQPRHPYVWEH